MKPEKEHLLSDLGLDESSREATMLAAAGILRRRRYWRASRQALWLVVVSAAITLGVERRHPVANPASSNPVSSKGVPATPIRALTDEQLLSLFPNTPVGLATLADGKKVLLFLRPGDAAKYAIRL